MRQYYPYSEYLKQKYGTKVYKLPINLPVTCPNRVKGDGCAFCAGNGTGFEAMDCLASVTEQLTKTRTYISARYHPEKYIAYFQNYTNTFLPLETFEAYIQEAAHFPDLVELAVSTRPDCIREDYLEVLRKVQRETGLGITIELGLQTVNYHTLDQMERGHGLAEFISAVWKIRSYPGFQICAHLILNLPGDDRRDSVETAKVMHALGIDIVKLHSLYIAKNTRLCDWYEHGKITVCSKEEYIQRAIRFLEHIPEDMAVERLFARVPEKDAVFCNWGESWWKLRDELIQEMIRQDTWQGRCCVPLYASALSALSEDGKEDRN